MAWHQTMADSDLLMGVCTEVMAGDEMVLLVRTGTGIRACASRCPHKFMNLDLGQVEGDRLTCPLHGATFDLISGQPDEETDWAGKLPIYPTKVVKGTICVKI